MYDALHVAIKLHDQGACKRQLHSCSTTCSDPAWLIPTIIPCIPAIVHQAKSPTALSIVMRLPAGVIVSVCHVNVSSQQYTGCS